MRKARSTLFTSLVIVVVVVLAGWLLVRGCALSRRQAHELPPVDEQLSPVPSGPDDFYHASAGQWRLETVVHLLTERKYVSSERELQQYLVREAKPGEIVRIVEARGRWKLLDVVVSNAPVDSGWADAEDKRAARIGD